MRKSTQRKVWPLRNPALPLTDKHQDDLLLHVHTAAARIQTVDGCNAFCRQLLVCSAAMQIDQTHDDHSRRLFRTACIMLEQTAKTGVVDDKTATYCKTVASWIYRWIRQGRVTYASFTEAKRIASNIDKQREKNGTA